MNWLFRSGSLISLSGILALVGGVLLFWQGDPTPANQAVPLPVPSGDQEVVWLNAATNVAWERFVAAVHRLQAARPGLGLTDFTVPPGTAVVASVWEIPPVVPTGPKKAEQLPPCTEAPGPGHCTPLKLESPVSVQPEKLPVSNPPFVTRSARAGLQKTSAVAHSTRADNFPCKDDICTSCIRFDSDKLKSRPGPRPARPLRDRPARRDRVDGPRPRKTSRTSRERTSCQ
jgi:hypothetical protein